MSEPRTRNCSIAFKNKLELKLHCANRNVLRYTILIIWIPDVKLSHECDCCRQGLPELRLACLPTREAAKSETTSSKSPFALELSLTLQSPRISPVIYLFTSPTSTRPSRYHSAGPRHTCSNSRSSRLMRNLAHHSPRKRHLQASFELSIIVQMMMK